MQSPAAPPTQGYPPYGYAPSPCYPPYYPWGYPAPYNAFPGSVFNSGGNVNESGYQKNGDVEVGNSKEKSGGVDIGKIGGNHGNNNGQQTAGDVAVGNIVGA